MSKNIYELALNEYTVIEETANEKTVVTLVPGGWIYTTSNVVGDDNGVSNSSSSVFVPFNKEFEEKKPTRIRSSGFL